MADGVTQVPPDSTGDKIDTETLTVGANTVSRQRVQLAGASALDLATVDATAGLKVDLGGDNDVVAAGDIAHDAADSGNPVKVGGKAFTTLPTAAATSDRVDQSMTTQGGALVAGTDGTTPRNVAVNASGQLEVDLSAAQHGDLNVSLDSEAVVLGAGTAEFGKLAAGTAAIGSLTAGTAEIGKLAAGTAAIGVVELGAGTAEFGKLAAGTAEIGKLAAGVAAIGVVELGAGTAEVGKLAAGVAKIGTALVSGTHVYDGLAGAPGEVEVKFASVDVASASDNEIVAAVASKSVRVLSYVLVASGGANTLTWKSATAGNISGGMGVADTGGISANSETGLFATTAGEALELTLSAATSVDGHISYIEVD